MPRNRRRFSESKLYHVTFRGIDKQDIFLEKNDYFKFLDILKLKKNDMDFKIYAYCLMTNHAHLLIAEKNTGDISTILKRCLISYVQFFNKKYERSGSLITERYFSAPVEHDKYLFNLIRYIHQNPLEIGYTLEYPWSSFLEYKKGTNDITDTHFILDTFDKKSFCQFHEEQETHEFEPNNSNKKQDIDLILYCEKTWNIKPWELKNLPQENISLILMDLKKFFSIRQISRTCKISRYLVQQYLRI